MDEAVVKKEIAQKINRINDARILESLDFV